MCLGIPGRITEVRPLGDTGLVEGKVDFGGVLKDVNLSFTPDVKVGEYVIVHVGFAISVVDEAEAGITLDYLAQLDALGEFEDQAQGGSRLDGPAPRP